MFHSYSQLLGLNEKSRESWLTAPIAGHTLSPDLFRITEADGYYLGNNGLTHVSQLFGEYYFTGGIRLGEDANLPQNIIHGEYLTNKCKTLRQALAITVSFVQMNMERRRGFNYPWIGKHLCSNY
jgi:hypothetical protein